MTLRYLCYNSTVNTRQLTPYEATQLARHGVTAESVTDPDKPIEYYTGVVDFLGFEFSVTPDVLIPRVETEELVEKVMRFIETLQPNGTLQLADVGTGSGAIAVSLSALLTKREITHHITAIDNSEAALTIAQKNAQDILGQNAPITFTQAHLLTNIAGPFNCIVANLPYIPTSRMSHLPMSVHAFEPHTALDGGPDGLSLIRELIEQSGKGVTTDGTLFLEVDDTHTAEVWTPFADTWNITTHTDSFGKNRFAVLQKKA